MIWLCTYGIKVGYDDPKVISRDKQGRNMFYGQREEKPYPLNSIMQPSELLCQGYIVH